MFDSQKIIDFYKKLSAHWKLATFSMSILFCFWVVPFCLFKPEIFNFPFYAQIALIFSMSFVWLFASLIFSIIILSLFDKNNDYSLAVSSLVGVILLNVSILISYFFSNSFTFFLRTAYLVMLGGFVLQIIIVSLIKATAKKSK